MFDTKLVESLVYKYVLHNVCLSLIKDKQTWRQIFISFLKVQKLVMHNIYCLIVLYVRNEHPGRHIG